MTFYEVNLVNIFVHTYNILQSEVNLRDLTVVLHQLNVCLGLYSFCPKPSDFE